MPKTLQQNDHNSGWRGKLPQIKEGWQRGMTSEVTRTGRKSGRKKNVRHSGPIIRRACQANVWSQTFLIFSVELPAQESTMVIRRSRQALWRKTRRRCSAHANSFLLVNRIRNSSLCKSEVSSSFSDEPIFQRRPPRLDYEPMFYSRSSLAFDHTFSSCSTAEDVSTASDFDSFGSFLPEAALCLI
jgi:hypothetical protein